MLTERERIAKLEAELVEIKSAISIGAAFAVSTIQSTLDQMVDEGLLPAATRTEIFGRIRKDADAARVGSDLVAKGARAAIPFYRTKGEAEELKHVQSRLRADEERLRKELLSPRTAKPESDQ